MNYRERRLIWEAYQSLYESTKRGKELVQQGKLSQKNLESIINVDPTPQKKFVGWMATQWVNKNVTDINELSTIIKKFDSLSPTNKTKSKDIYAYKTFGELKEEISNLRETGQDLSEKDLKSDFEVFKNDENLLVMIPHTHEASRKLGLSHFAFRDCEEGGKDSAWCTTYKDSNNFNDYYHNYNITFYYIKVKSEKLQQELKKAKYGPSFFVTAISVMSHKESIKMKANDGLNKEFSGAKLTKYLEIIGLDKSLLVPRRSKEEREKNYKIASSKKVQEYIKDGSVGDLNLSDTPITSLPEGLKVGGNLDLGNTPITSLPKGLKVGGNLDLENTPITSLPKGLKVSGTLSLVDTPITSFPNNLEVGGDLFLNNTSITSLPNGLKIGGSLFLNNTPITSLPKGLEVGRDLYLNNTLITSLPFDLKVRGSLDLNNTPLSKKYTEEQIKKMYPGIYAGGIVHKRIQEYINNGSVGDLYLGNTSITSLPEGLKVEEGLYLGNTPITSLPKGLEVGRSLYLYDTPITSLPNDLKVGGGLALQNTPLSKKYTKEQIKQMCPGIQGDVYLSYED